MIQLLDVNALIAWGVRRHEFHDRVKVWLRDQDFPPIATCAITELGFVRVLAQTPHYGLDLQGARVLLVELKQQLGAKHIFLRDGNDISRLPNFVRSHRQLTDGHLLQLAKDHGVVLATLDEGIPGATLIPRSA